MRPSSILMAVVAVVPLGCSALVVSAGYQLNQLANRDQVHQKFGSPVSIEETDGKISDEFTTHRKIARPHESIYFVMGSVSTFGFGELIFFPQQLYHAAKRSIVGQKLRFTYDSEGRVTKIVLDGDHYPVPVIPADRSP
ncbi:hypothetical protein [Tuwongella immobilis]|uniref:Uncharacterized protein n=1 Tax=Tuwongella immobilis TaxID=692036 RepID=A0A6C2YUV9_9BACT|nr:hypothetical protein [Tuwongella immobilis]VIP05147.1 unnamed protein product [Tuwongella immobilis]VTS07650.1 unnamed protein product [Tuwongella immobilis]